MFVTESEIRSLASFDEVRDLSSEMMQHYIDRADLWITRATNRDYSNTENKFIQSNLKHATIMLIEYLVYWDVPEVKETMLGPNASLTLGSYKVNYKGLGEWKQALPGEETGIKELDSILENLKYKPSTMYFKVLGK